MRVPSLLLSAAAAATASDPLSIQQAIRMAWSRHGGLLAGEAMVEKARMEALSMHALRFPTVALSAGLRRTDEPMTAFGMKLNQARITQADFMPDRLNRPDAMTGFGTSLDVTQPLYAGGRIRAARRAGATLAEAEAAIQAHRRQQVACAVVEAYFGIQVGTQGLAWAEDALRQARETEAFTAARAGEGLMLRSEADRARAFRAQAEAGVAGAKARLASLHSALSLLTGGLPVDTPLGTPLQDLPAEAAAPPRRGDIEALRLQVEAARAGAAAASSALRPEVGLTASLGAARYTWNRGGAWSTVGLGATWSFSAADLRRASAARAAERAAELAFRWQEVQSLREAEEARRAVETAEARLASAREALAASESVRTLRHARHREGLLPLVEVLDAEAGLSGARALLAESQLELRLSRAALDLATGQPVEGVKE